MARILALGPPLSVQWFDNPEHTLEPLGLPTGPTTIITKEDLHLIIHADPCWNPTTPITKEDWQTIHTNATWARVKDTITHTEHLARHWKVGH